MLATQARGLLDEIKPLAQPVFDEIIAEKAEQKTVAGNFSEVSFHHMKGARRFRFGREKKHVDSLSVAYLKPKPTTTPEDLKEAIQAEKLLQREGVPQDFNQFDFYFNEQGERLAIRSDRGDLLQFVTANKGLLTVEEVKEITAQVILAVYDLHSRDIVHRDIKPENFLIFFRNGKYHVKLHDHEGALKVDSVTGAPVEKLKTVFMTRDYSSDELKNICERMTPRDSKEEKKLEESPESKEAWKDHDTLNFKANDCFALGETIKVIYHLFPASASKNAFNRLHSVLTRKAAERWTVNQVMGFAFFGSESERVALFDKLRVRAKDNVLKLDGYSHRPVAVGDPFYLLDHSIKPLHRAAQQALQLAEEITNCDKQIAERCEKGRFSEITARFSALNATTARLNKTVAIGKARDYADNLAALKQTAQAQTKNVVVKLLKDKHAMASLLTKAVAEAYADYVKVNQLENDQGEEMRHCFDFFRRHGKQGREQARALKEKVDRAFQSDNSHPKEIFDLIHDHYFHSGGNTNKHSFKTILAEKFYQLSDFSIEGWKNFFDAEDKIALKA